MTATTPSPDTGSVWRREPGVDYWTQVWTCCGGPFAEGRTGHRAGCVVAADQSAAALEPQNAAVGAGSSDERALVAQWLHGLLYPLLQYASGGRANADWQEQLPHADELLARLGARAEGQQS